MQSGALLSGRLVPLFLALPVLTASAILPWEAGWVCAVTTIVVLGVPHGALDVEIGRNLLRSRLGSCWFPIFAGPYLLLVGVVLLAWRWAPEVTLAAFLAASVWHFGKEDAGCSNWSALFRGGLPIALPVLFHPTAAASVFSAVSGLAYDQPPAWLTAASILWLIPALVMVLRSRKRDLLLPGGLCVAYVIWPPLTAFALYFVAVHAPAHMAALIHHARRAPRIRNWASAWTLAAPTSILTVAIGAALWPTYSGDLAPRLLSLTMQMLAALTLPHMLLDVWLEHRERSASCEIKTSLLDGKPLRIFQAPLAF